MTSTFWKGSHYLEWLLEKQDVARNRAVDIEILGSEEDYQKIMIFFSNVIQTFGKGVDVRQQVIATALVYFKRFYSCYSLKTIDPWLMSPACLFLASKIEEFGVISQKVLMNTCKNVVQSLYSTYFGDSSYPYRPVDVLECEFILLETLDCSMVIFHPYRSLLCFLDDLKPEINQHYDLILQKTWKIINDSYKTDLCLFYPPFLIALGCLMIAFSMLASQNSSKNENFSNLANISENWFSELQVDLDSILEVSRCIMNLYHNLNRFDETVEMPKILAKIPKPTVVQTNANSAAISGSQSSNQIQGNNTHQMIPNQGNKNNLAINPPLNNQQANKHFMNNQAPIGHHQNQEILLNSMPNNAANQGKNNPGNNPKNMMQQHPMAPSNFNPSNQPNRQRLQNTQNMMTHQQFHQ